MVDNSATQGGGIYNSYSNPNISNSIIWGNNPDSITGSSAEIVYSIIQGGYPGTRIIDQDPLLGTVEEYSDFPVYPLLPGSPAIDSGDPDLSTCAAVDQRGISRPQDGDGDSVWICDIGGFEYFDFSLLTNKFFLPIILK